MDDFLKEGIDYLGQIPNDAMLAIIQNFYDQKNNSMVFNVGTKFLIEDTFDDKIVYFIHTVRNSWNRNDEGLEKLQRLIPIIKQKKCWIWLEEEKNKSKKKQIEDLDF